MKSLKEYAPGFLRISLSLVFLWFGFNQLFDTDSWIGYLPQWGYNLPIVPELLIQINGAVEIVLGTLLLLGLFTRLTALILTIHLLGISFNLGYNDVAIRDVGLSLATFAVFLHGKDRWSLDKKFNLQDKRILRFLYFLDKEKTEEQTTLTENPTDKNIKT